MNSPDKVNLIAPSLEMQQHADIHDMLNHCNGTTFIATIKCFDYIRNVQLATNINLSMDYPTLLRCVHVFTCISQVNAIRIRQSRYFRCTYEEICKHTINATRMCALESATFPGTGCEKELR